MEGDTALSRSQRLLDLLQILRRHRRPISGRALAEQLGISLRTLYCDIATLQAQGATIRGEAGLGYVLDPGYLLPPLMFTAGEIEALVLGARWVESRAEETLASAARDVLAKVSAVLPPELCRHLRGSALLVGPATSVQPISIDPSILRRAIEAECKIELAYRDGKGDETHRVVWPFALAYFDAVRILVGWCEARQAYRHFRADRIGSIVETSTRYPRRRHALLEDWRLQEGIARDLG